MEGITPMTEQVIKVERGFEGSRLAGQSMASAYQCVLPVIRHRMILESPGPFSETCHEDECIQQRQASGA
ncbi:MAG: hypothetical protein GY906_21615 [bacterium]|nr:hypothetical protein [bacterium]